MSNSSGNIREESWTSRRRRAVNCCRQGCQSQAEAEITLGNKGEKTEEKTFALCLYHYYESLNVVMGVKILTGIPEIQQDAPLPLD